MVRSALRRAARLAAPLIVLTTPIAAGAADHFLTIGGGDAPTHNQVSLEKNVQYMQRVLDELGLAGVHHDIYFSDGGDPGRDVQAHAEKEPPRANQLLARLLGGSESAIRIEYRSAALPKLAGPSNRKSLGEWFEKTGSKLADGDRLIIYFTGHGGRGQPNAPRNTNFTMWREPSMPVKEFAGLLDKLPPKVQVVIVMVQCHSGGFADLIFKNGEYSNKPAALAATPRVGFFATVPERPAAGCTPDINEENYHEYSTYFWEAICGKTRLGSNVEKPDYDGDGHISFAEAHAYVKLTSSTIDIPVATSDVLLRTFSKAHGVSTASLANIQSAPTPTPQPTPGGFRRRPGGAAPGGTTPGGTTPGNTAPGVNGPTGGAGGVPAPDNKPTDDQKNLKLLAVDSSYFDVVATADPARKAVLEGLSKQLGFGGPERARAARDLLNKLKRDRDDLENQKRTAARNLQPLKDKLVQAVRARWPELTVPFHPRQADILRSEADAVVKFIESHEGYKPYEDQRSGYEKLDERSTELERKWVKAQRFLRTLEEVALAANLQKVAPPEVVKRYDELLKAEYGSVK